MSQTLHAFKKSITGGVFSTRAGILLSNVSSTGGTGSVIPFGEKNGRNILLVTWVITATCYTNPKVFILIENGMMARQ